MCTLNLKRAGWIGFCAMALMGLAKADPSILDSPGSTAAAAGVAPEDVASDFKNIEIVDPSLNKKITPLRIGSSRAPNDLLTVFAGLKNMTGRHLTLEVMTIYKDKFGQELNTGSWIKLTIKPHEEADYRSSSITASAADFVIRIRRPATATASTHD